MYNTVYCSVHGTVLYYNVLHYNVVYNTAIYTYGTVLYIVVYIVVYMYSYFCANVLITHTEKNTLDTEGSGIHVLD